MRLSRRYPSLKSKLPAELEDAREDAKLNSKEWLLGDDYNPDNFIFP